MCKETKFGLAVGILMIIIMAIGVRSGEPKQDGMNVKTEKMAQKNQGMRFQTTSLGTNSKPNPGVNLGPTLE